MLGSPSAILAAPTPHLVLTDSGQVVYDFCEESTLTRRLAVNQHTTLPWSFEKDLVEYETAGIGAVGLVKSKIDQYGAEDAVDTFLASRLTASSLDWIGGFTGHNGYSLADVIDEGVETLRLAHELGVPTVVALAGPRNGHIWNQLDKILVSSLRELSDYAERLGISIALMPMGPTYHDQWSYLRTFEDAINVVKQVDRANVGLTIHTMHVFRESGLPNLLRQAAAWTKLVRLGDCGARSTGNNDQRWLGKGIVPVTAIAAALDDAGYRGYYEVDVWSRNLWSDGGFRPLLKSLRELTFGSPPPPAPVPV